MTGLGLVGLGAAVVNYRKAKNDYEKIAEQQSGMVAAINTYNQQKLDGYIKTIDEKPNSFPPGVSFAPLMRVGNLVGNLMRVHGSVVLSNTSKNTYYIKSITSDCCLNIEDVQVPIMVFSNIDLFNMGDSGKKLSQTSGSVLPFRPGSTLEIYFKSGISGLGDYMGWLRDAICEVNGKKLITSCPKTSLEGILTADIIMDWSTEKNGATQRGYIEGKPGVLRYCGEAYYPED